MDFNETFIIIGADVRHRVHHQAIVAEIGMHVEAGVQAMTDIEIVGMRPIRGNVR